MRWNLKKQSQNITQNITAAELSAAEQRGYLSGIASGRRHIVGVMGDLRKDVERHLAEAERLADKAWSEQMPAPKAVPRSVPSAPPLSPSRAKAPTPIVGAGDYSGPQLKVLRSLAMWKALGHESPTREMVAAVAGYKPSTGNYNNLIGGLVTLGAVGKPGTGLLSLLIDPVDMIDKGQGRDMLLATLSGPQRKIVGALIDAGAKSREQLAQESGYQPGTGNYNNLLGSLNTIGVTVKPATGQISLSEWAQELLTGYAQRLAA